jgi:hypothetical protein
LTPDSEIDPSAVTQNGILYLTGTYVGYLITSNMGITATLVHIFLWNYDDIKEGWSFMRPTNLKKVLQPSFWTFWKGGRTKEERQLEAFNDLEVDPHYKLMVANGYDEVPNWWYALVLVGSFMIALGTLYAINSTLPWWGFIIANLLSALFVLFFGAQYGLTGFQFNQQPIVQMLAGYLHPGKPLGMYLHSCQDSIS